MTEEVELRQIPNGNNTTQLNKEPESTETEPSHNATPVNNGISIENHNVKDAFRRPKNFEDLLEKHVGGWGPFQLKLTLLLCLILQQGTSPLRNNIIYILDVPDHWCHVPGRYENMSLESWKNLTIPWELGANGRMRQSQCNMYEFEGGNVTSCSKWEYDQTDYTLTIPSQNDWVCEKRHYPTNCFTARNIGGAMGKLLFGVISDKFGRKPAFFFLFLVMISASSAGFLLAENYWWFLGLSFARGLAGGSIFEMCSLIATEQCGSAYRSTINAIKWSSYIAANIGSVLLVMYTKDWHLFGWISLGMGCIGLVICPFLPESARWLVSQGKCKEATKVLVKMAKENGKEGNKDIIGGDVKYLVDENNKVPKGSLRTIFSNGRLCFNFIMLTICISVSTFMLDMTYLNATHMGGYKFLNVIILFVAGLAGGSVGGLFMNSLGRRWTQLLAFLLVTVAGLFCALAVPFMGDWEVLGGAIFIKIGEAIASVAGATIRDELLPTPIRSSASGLAQFIAALCKIVVPDIVEIGNDNGSFPYEIIAFVCLLGTIAALFLPETLHQRLPETIEEANNFSTSGRFWNFRPSAVSYNNEDESMQMDRRC